ncbi:unnamed protein product [Rhizoctonia solani]|uniref:Phosphatidylglycerophosphatase GEP4, mitochondrial n=1 Tax=Rhizoctonia solani TaxID=456999 RepID=A0A8H3GQM5_9AGAM|nr:unnamed protein product [Rhizoctonia solani]
MSNLHGSIFALRALLKPGLLLPGIKVETISRLNFSALKQAGYTGVVFDRDNCLTVPHHDTLVPELADAWDRCKASFGRENMLIVSNSAGTSDDPLGIQADSIAHNLGVPVLRHRRKKPACGEEIIQYFRLKQATSISKGPDTVPSPTEGKIIHAPNLNTPLDLDNQANPTLPELETQVAVQPTTTEGPRLLIIGDRLLTDILLSNALSSSNHHLPIWTTRLWKTPDLPILRFAEKSVLRMLLWNRNQTFRNGVVEQRAKGETWLGKERWLWRIRRWVLVAIRRGEYVPPESIPQPTNQLARFILPLPAIIPWRPTTHLGWTWYYSKVLAKHAGRGSWIILGWVWAGMSSVIVRSWSLSLRKIREARARRMEKTPMIQPTEAKS